MLAGTAVAREPSDPSYGIYAYTAREWDPEIGLYYYRARYYDPKVGRFISEDPIRFRGGLPSFYAYVGNSPATYVDPAGLLVESSLAVGLGLGLGLSPAGWAALAGAVAVGTAAMAWEMADDDYGRGQTTSPPSGMPAAPVDEPTTDSEEDSSPRSVPLPERPRCGCTCTCRADADDTMPGNIKAGVSRFAMATVTGSNCTAAKKAAKKLASQRLGMKAKHTKCRCSGR